MSEPKWVRDYREKQFSSGGTMGPDGKPVPLSQDENMRLNGIGGSPSGQPAAPQYDPIQTIKDAHAKNLHGEEFLNTIPGEDAASG